MVFYKSKIIEDPFQPKNTNNGSRPVTAHYPNNMQQRVFQKDGEFDHVRFAVSTVYQGFKLVKTSQHGSWGVYKAPVISMMANVEKYIVAVVNNDSAPLGAIAPIESLNWTSFQTRSCNDIQKEMSGYYLAQQGYSLPRERNTVLYDKVKKVIEYDHKAIYLPDNLPIKIEVIKSKPDEFLAEEGNVIAAMEIFNTIIELQDTD